MQFLDHLESMPLNQADRDWVNKQIRKAEKQADEGTPRRERLSLWWRRNWGVVIAILVAAGAWIQPQMSTHAANDLHNDIGNEVRAQLNQPLQQINQMSGDIREIKGELEVLKPLIIEQERKNVSSGLSKLRGEVETAQQQHSSVQPTLVRQIQDNVRRLPQDSPDYWPTVLRFISLATAGLSPNAPAPGKPGIVLSSAVIVGNGLRGITDHNIILLDGGYMEDVQIHNSRIIFTDHPVEMLNVTFIDCVFEMPVTDNPPPHIQKAAQILLAQDLRSPKIRTLS